MTTKTEKLRQSKDDLIRFIEADGGEMYLLIAKDKMVKVVDVSNTHVTHTIKTYYQHSLPWRTLRAWIRRGTNGRIRGGWSFRDSGDCIRIGCQRFSGKNLAALRLWAG